MASIRAGLRSQGLEPTAFALVLLSRRQSTNRLYDIRWKFWFEYCQEKQRDAIHRSVPQMAVFLTYLHREKQLSAITIAGYKSVIFSTVALTHGLKYPSFSYSVVLNLFKKNGFRHSAPLHRSLCPKWDVTFVLTFLRERCEPLHALFL